MKLRDAISEYSKWIAAIWGAASRQQIDPMDAWDKINDIKRELRRWIGDDLLNKEL